MGSTTAQLRHGCTSLLLTPYRMHNNKCGHSHSKTQGYKCYKQTNCDTNDLCDQLESQNIVDGKYAKEDNGHSEADIRKAMCISLVRAR